MGYTVEVSFDISKKTALTMFQGEQRTIANNHDCEMQYFIHDIFGNGKKSNAVTVYMSLFLMTITLITSLNTSNILRIIEETD